MQEIQDLLEIQDLNGKHTTNARCPGRNLGEGGINTKQFENISIKDVHDDDTYTCT